MSKQERFVEMNKIDYLEQSLKRHQRSIFRLNKQIELLKRQRLIAQFALLLGFISMVIGIIGITRL